MRNASLEAGGVNEDAKKRLPAEGMRITAFEERPSALRDASLEAGGVNEEPMTLLVK